MSSAESPLEEVVRLLESERIRQFQEAPWPITKAYAELLIANGFGRIGRPERGRELVASAREVLVPLCERERMERGAVGVHGYLLDVLLHRFSEAWRFRPRETLLPTTLREAHDDLDRVSRYKVDRLAEFCVTVSLNGRTGSVNALGNWISGQRGILAHGAPSRLQELRGLEPISRAERIAAELLVRVDVEQVELIDAFCDLPTDAALTVLPSVVASARNRGPLLEAGAYFLAARFGYGELGIPLLESLRATLATTRPDDASACLRLLLRGMRWLDTTSELLPELERMWSRVEKEGSLLIRSIVAAALSSITSDRTLSNLVDDELAAFADIVQAERLECARTLLGAITYADAPSGFELVTRLAHRMWPTASDTYGTNSHYCLSVLRLVEALVLAHVDLTLGSLDVVDPDNHDMLRSGFAF